MCGRIFQTLPLHRLIAIARAAAVTHAQNYSSSYNVCPTTYIPAIRCNRRFGAQSKEPEPAASSAQDKEISPAPDAVPTRQLTFMKWGHQSPHNFIINARSEELTQKRTFLKLIENRCVVLMEGYFEWKEKDQPFMFKSKKEDHLMVAGLYTNQDEVIILTKEATPELAAVHHRMPVILSPEDVEVWLNPDNTKEISKIIENSFAGKDKPIWKDVGFTRLGPHVNSIKEKSAKCIMSFEEYKKELDRTGIMRFFKKPQPKKEVIVDSTGEKAEVAGEAPTPSPEEPTAEKGKESKKRDLDE